VIQCCSRCWVMLILLGRWVTFFGIAFAGFLERGTLFHLALENTETNLIGCGGGESGASPGLCTLIAMMARSLRDPVRYKAGVAFPVQASGGNWSGPRRPESMGV